MDANGLVSSVFRVLESSHGIVCNEVSCLDLGNVCKTVYQAKRGEEYLVVKLGIGERAALEVQKNRQGYEELRAIGASALLPARLEYHEVSGVALLIMSDCGLDFVRATRVADDPEALYKALVVQIRPVYLATKHEVSPLTAINAARDNLVRQCTLYLQGLLDHRLVERARLSSFNEFASACSCFSSFDFTPEDVFVTSSGVKYVDPIPGQLGIPVIDLACFAGVARDAYILPGSTCGYDVLKQFALQELPQILNISHKNATRLFALGRALQCALSARFRLHVNHIHALNLVRMCEQYLERCVN